MKAAPELATINPSALVEVLKALAHDRRYQRLAVFGSVARREARDDSDIDLLVEAPLGVSSLEFVAFGQLLVDLLGREVDLIDYASLMPGVDDDILTAAVLL